MPTGPINEQDTGQSVILEPLLATPWSPSWWTTQNITGVPADSLGWHLAQGWVVTDISNDNTTVPPTPSYDLTRDSLNNQLILQSLLDSYVFFYNLSTFNNAVRYNDIIRSWDTMLETTHDQFAEQYTEQNDHVTLFLAELTTYMDDIDALVDANQTQLIIDRSTADTALSELDTKLDALEPNVVTTTATITSLITGQEGYLSTFITAIDANYTAHLSTIGTLLSGEDTNLATFVTSQAAQLTAIATNLAEFATEFETPLDDLEPDYDVHFPQTIAYLDGLGATELARINEEFEARLSSDLQRLTDHGLYTTSRALDITERNTRDRDEQVQALNDRLMREKLENQHQIYGQQVAMRNQLMDRIAQRHDVKQAIAVRLIEEAARLQQLQLQIAQWNTSVRDSLYAQLQGVETQTHGAQQDVTRFHMGEHERLLQLLQDAVRGVIAGLDTVSSRTTSNASTFADHKHRQIAEKFQEAAQRLDGLQQKHAEWMRLMEYQLQVRNDILVGLYGFVERRDDIPPSFEALTQVATGLGDSGGGWVTP